MELVRVNLGPRSYDIRIEAAETAPAVFGAFARRATPYGTSALIVADANCDALAAQIQAALEPAGFRTSRFVVPAGETSKSPGELAMLYDALAALPADRQTLVVAVGGGVVGDLAGFAAATYNRGLPLLMVPTTLLAMVDSSVGGKTGINHAAGKNLIGAFHQPAGVWIDVSHLNTLPDREYRSGLGEVVKYGVILDAEFFAWLEANAAAILARDPAAVRFIVARCCRLKASVVEDDEFDLTGRRAVLNYGHTFAHAFENVGCYGTWLHGEAVAAGMACAARLAEALGRTPADFTRRLNRLLEAFGLPLEPDPTWDAEAILAAMRRDKKAAAGALRFLLPSQLGQVELVDGIEDRAVIAALRPA